MIETERRFLLRSLPNNLAELKALEIEDKMLLTGEDHPHLRLRRQGLKWMLTKKYPKNSNDDHTEMVEETIDLSEIEYKALSKLDGVGQKKTRYYPQIGDYEAELDLWHEELSGLAVLEVEFPGLEEAKNFMMPEYCLIEITGVEWLAGGRVAGKRFEELEPELTKLGYKKLVY